MSDRPSDGMGLDELREEFDWMFEFDSRMAERIRDDADVHNLADYVGKLDGENARLRDELAKWERLTDGIDLPEYPVVQFAPKDLERENAKLRELVRDMWWQLLNAYDYKEVDDFADRMRELGVAE